MKEKTIITGHLYTGKIEKGVIGIVIEESCLAEARQFYREVQEASKEKDEPLETRKEKIETQEANKAKSEPLRLEIELRRWRKHRTVNQLRLLHAVINRIAEKHEVKPNLIYAGVKEEFYPLYPETWRGRPVKKETADLDTLEMSRVIEATVNEALEIGADIKDIWCLWYEWRGEQEAGDPLEASYASIEDYRQRHPVCEACGKWLGEGGGEAAHIVPKGSGGSDEDWNLLMLCVEHHRGTVHQEGGFEGLTKLAPHLRWKIEKSVDRHGRGATKIDRMNGDATNESSELFHDDEMQIF